MSLLKKPREHIISMLVCIDKMMIEILSKVFECVYMTEQI